MNRMVRKVTNWKTLNIVTLMILILPVFFSLGCTEELSAEDIADQMQQKEASIQDYSYTMNIVSSYGGDVQESELQILQKKPNKTKILGIKPEDEAGTLVVSDGEFMWTYNAKTNTVLKTKMPETQEIGEIDYVEIVRDLLNETNVSVLGTEEIEGRSTYMLEANLTDPEKESQLFETVKLWVDKETWMPLRYEIYDSNETQVLKMEIHDLKVNTDIPDSEFVFEIPAGATVKNMDSDSYQIPASMTLEEAKEHVQFEVLVPEYLPEGYEFSDATAYNNSETADEGHAAETVILRYIKGNDSLILAETVYEGQAQEAAIMNSAENISINGVEGKYLALGEMQLLNWKVGNVDISLSASLEKEELLKVAESVSEKL